MKRHWSENKYQNQTLPLGLESKIINIKTKTDSKILETLSFAAVGSGSLFTWTLRMRICRAFALPCFGSSVFGFNLSRLRRRSCRSGYKFWNLRNQRRKWSGSKRLLRNIQRYHDLWSVERSTHKLHVKFVLAREIRNKYISTIYKHNNRKIH